jgi:hypothetical protein
MGWMGIVLISIGATIIGGIILSFIMPILKKPRDKFIKWIQKIFTKKKREAVTVDLNKEQKLKQLIQNKFNREREKIDSELDKNIGNIMEKFAHKGTLTSGMFVKEAIYLHSDRIFKLLLSRASINREVLLENKPIESDKEIELAMQDLEEIAEAQKSVIFRCENILNRMNEKDYFVRRMSENRTTILSDIERYLINEKDENLLLKKGRR